MKENIEVNQEKLENWKDIKLKTKKKDAVTFIVILKNSERLIEVPLDLQLMDTYNLEEILQELSLHFNLDLNTISVHSIIGNSQYDYLIKQEKSENDMPRNETFAVDEKIELEKHEISRESDKNATDKNKPEVKKIQYYPPCYLHCSVINVGSYKCVSSREVTVDFDEIKMFIPKINDARNEICIRLKTINILRVIVYLEKQTNSIFIYTNSLMAKKIRDALTMCDPEGLYYDPESPNVDQTRIVLILSNVYFKERQILRYVFDNKLFYRKDGKKDCHKIGKHCKKEGANETKDCKIDSYKKGKSSKKECDKEGVDFIKDINKFSKDCNKNNEQNGTHWKKDQEKDHNNSKMDCDKGGKDWKKGCDKNDKDGKDDPDKYSTDWKKSLHKDDKDLKENCDINGTDWTKDCEIESLDWKKVWVKDDKVWKKNSDKVGEDTKKDLDKTGESSAETVQDGNARRQSKFYGKEQATVDDWKRIVNSYTNIL